MKTKHSPKRLPTVAILYHYVPKEVEGSPTDKQHALVDSDTTRTVDLVRTLLRKKGFRIRIIKVSDADLSELKNTHADYIINLVDSRAMELEIAEILERLHTPFSGSSHQAIYNSNNKIRAKAIFTKHNLPTPPYTLIPHSQTKLTRSFLPGKFPLIVKPAFEHCSVGITDKSVITTFKQFKNAVKRLRSQVKQTLICESFIKGREIQILVIETGNLTIALPPAEMRFKGKYKSKWNIYGFVEKWDKHSVRYKDVYFESPPSKLNLLTIQKMQRDAIRAFYAMGFHDYGRFDFRYNPKTNLWYFLEGNANPGISDNPEDACMASVTAGGFTIEDVILGMIANAIPSVRSHLKR